MYLGKIYIALLFLKIKEVIVILGCNFDKSVKLLASDAAVLWM